MGSVWIPGSYQGDFARNYAREGLEISDMVAEAVAGTLEAASQARDCQVDGARTFATLNIGGSLTTTVSFVVTSE